MSDAEAVASCVRWAAYTLTNGRDYALALDIAERRYASFFVWVCWAISEEAGLVGWDSGLLVPVRTGGRRGAGLGEDLIERERDVFMWSTRKRVDALLEMQRRKGAAVYVPTFGGFSPETFNELMALRASGFDEWGVKL